MLTCKLFQKFFVLARIFRFWKYSLIVNSLLLNSSRVLIAGFSFLMSSASSVSNLMLLDAWSIIFHLNSDLLLSLPHWLICCRTGVSSFRCSSILGVRCRTVWPTYMDLHPQLQICTPLLISVHWKRRILERAYKFSFSSS